MVPAGTLDGIRWYRSIERDEASLAPNGEREQVDVGQLPRTVNSSRVDQTRIEEADIGGPELMQGARGCLGKTLNNRSHR